MGCFSQREKKKKNNPYEKDLRSLTEKIRLLQLEINEMMCEREKEARASEREVMVFAFKEAEWKQERKRMKEEVKKLRKMVDEKDEIIRGIGNGEKSTEREDQVLRSSPLAELMKEERARRDETVEKWKRLYLAIKTELDDLIQRTNGDGLYWRGEEESLVEELKGELKDKEETIEALKAKLTSMEQKQCRTEREVDILRQSLRIVSNNKTATQMAKSLSRLRL